MLGNFPYSTFVCVSLVSIVNIKSKKLLKIGRIPINHRDIDSDTFFKTLGLPAPIWNILILPMHEYMPGAVWTLPCNQSPKGGK